MPAPLRFLRTACLLLALLVVPSAAASASDLVLRLGSINTEGTAPYDQALVPFARAVEQESGGRIEVALKPVGGYGKPTELFNMVEKGDIEMAATVQGYNPGRFPQSSVMELPFMFPNAVSGTLRMRTPSITVGLALAKLGAVPLGIPLNTIGDSIASGYVDAISYGFDSTTTTKGAGGKVLSDQLSVVIDAQLAAPALMVVMNRAKWEALPDDLKAILEKHGAELARMSARVRDAQEAVTKKKIQSDPRFTALNFSDEQRAELMRVTAPAVQEWKANMAKLGIDGDRLYRRAIELIARYKVAAK